MPAYKHNSPKKKKKSNWVSRLKKSIAALGGPGHSPAGKKYLASKGKKIAYYGQGRETADAMLRRIKRGK